MKNLKAKVNKWYENKSVQVHQRIHVDDLSQQNMYELCIQLILDFKYTFLNFLGLFF